MSSSRDARAHVRADSIAYKRVPPSPEKKRLSPAPTERSTSSSTRPLTSSSELCTSTSSARVTWSYTDCCTLTTDPADALASLSSRKQRVQLAKLAVALLSVFLLYRCVSPWIYDTQVTNQIKARKMRLQGVGESHVLPKRFRDEVAGLGTKGEALPECKRVLLFTFSK